MLICFLLSLLPATHWGQSIPADGDARWRSKIHFTPRSHWINDPNGMIYYQGAYHLFFQYHPYSSVWGPMHWGHAISKNLMDWEEKPIALYPDSLGYIFSGSAVLDAENTSGFGSKQAPPLVAIFTHHDAKREGISSDYQQQSLAYSLDSGATWVKYAGNPVLKNPGITDFRDPKVMWHAPTRKWIMTLATKDCISFYSAPDLKNWKPESIFGKNLGAHGGVWECPDLFPLSIDGKAIWVLVVNLNPGAPNGGSGTQYFMGDFDGQVFTPMDTMTRWIDHGPDEYAGVTWHNTGNRTLFMGWMSNWDYANVLPTVSWRNAMTLPRELKIRKIGETYAIASVPARELYDRIASSSQEKILNPGKGRTSTPMEFSIASPSLIRLRTNSASSFDLIFTGAAGDTLQIGYDESSGNYFIDRRRSGLVSFHPRFAGRSSAPRLSRDAAIELTLVMDVNAVELFADDGLTVMTSLFFPREPFGKLTMRSEKGLAGTKISIDALAPMRSR